MLIDWTSTFDGFLDRLEAQGGHRLDTLLSLLEVLENLDGLPEVDSVTFKRVQQGRRYPLWRVAHPFVPGIAMRLIVWFAPSGEVVVSATAFNKAGAGDIWDASAVATANAVIDEWKRVNDKMSDENITFVRGNARLEQLLRDPERRARVNAIREGIKQSDREHAMGLAMVRQAADLTQQDLADFLGVSQVAIQKTEQRSDMLLSTLRRYLLAAGADMEITVRWPDGRHAELTLDELEKAPQTTG